MLARIIPTPSYISESVRGAMTRPSLSLVPTFLCCCFLVSRGVVIVGKLAKSGPRTRFHGSVGIGGWRIQRKRLTSQFTSGGFNYGGTLGSRGTSPNHRRASRATNRERVA